MCGVESLDWREWVWGGLKEWIALQGSLLRIPDRTCAIANSWRSSLPSPVMSANSQILRSSAFGSPDLVEGFEVWLSHKGGTPGVEGTSLIRGVPLYRGTSRIVMSANFQILRSSAFGSPDLA